MEKERWKYIEQGDIDVYSETYVFYYKKLYNYGRKFTENTTLIEDAIQSIFITLWNNRQRLSTINSPHTYIFSSFRNHIFKEKRKLQRVSFPREDREFGIENLITSKEATIELNERLQKAIASLTRRQREAIFLRFYEGLSFEEVAQIMEISVKGTYKLIARSLLKLKDLLEIPTIMVLTLLDRIWF